jgi:hypothetical protein
MTTAPSDTPDHTLEHWMRMLQQINEAPTPKAKADLRLIMQHAVRLQERMTQTVHAHRYRNTLLAEMRRAGAHGYNLETSRSFAVRAVLGGIPRARVDEIHTEIIREHQPPWAKLIDDPDCYIDGRPASFKLNHLGR